VHLSQSSAQDLSCDEPNHFDLCLTYDRNGETTLDIAGLAGLYSGPMIMTAWYPDNYTALGYGVRQGNIAAAIKTGIDLIREFGPDLKRTFSHR